MTQVNLYALSYPVTALGPGKRLALWVAGCGKRCPGCISPEMQSPDSGKKLEVETLLSHISRLPMELEGLTISGGEPFDQPEAIVELLEGIRSRFPQWNIILYSGYTLPTLRKGHRAVQKILKLIDVLIDGPFRRENPSIHPLTGSGNQHLRYLTPRGKDLKSNMDKIPFNQANLGMGPGKMKMIIGILDPLTRESVHKSLGIHGEVGINE